MNTIETTITRNPAADEADETQLANRRARCDMPADEADFSHGVELTLGDRSQHFHYVDCERARRAGPETRLAVLDSFDLTNWKSAVRAIVAVGYGQIPLLDKLASLVYSAESGEEAARVIKAFKFGLGASNTPDYIANRVVVAMETATVSMDAATGAESHNQKKTTIEAIARLAGLLALSIEDEWFDSTSPPGYRETGRRFDLNAVLAQGWASFTADITSALRYWEGLANRGESVPLPDALNCDNITVWAQAVMQAGDTYEPGMAPWAMIRPTDNELRLSWDGRWTQGRGWRLIIRFEEDGSVKDAVSDWITGTGRPSKFLSIEDLLVLDACTDFGANMPQPTA